MVLTSSALYRLPEGKTLNTLCVGCGVSQECYLPIFLTRDQYRSWKEGRLALIILSADLIVCCNLFLSCLVSDPNKTVMEVQRTEKMIAV